MDKEFSEPRCSKKLNIFSPIKFYPSSKYGLTSYTDQEVYNILSNYVKTAKIPEFYESDLGKIKPVLNKINKEYDIVYLSNIISQDRNVMKNRAYSLIDMETYNDYVFSILRDLMPFLNTEFTIIVDYFYGDSIDRNCERLLDSQALLDIFNIKSYFYPVKQNSNTNYFDIFEGYKDVAVVLRSAKRKSR